MIWAFDLQSFFHFSGKKYKAFAQTICPARVLFDEWCFRKTLEKDKKIAKRKIPWLFGIDHWFT